MKFAKIISLLAAMAVLLSSFAFMSYAVDGLVDEAPEDLYFSFRYPTDGNEIIDVSYFVPEKICRFTSMQSEDKITNYGVDGSVSIAFDWSVDSESDWQADKTDDKIESELGIDFIFTSEFMRFIYAEDVAKCKDAVITTTNDFGEELTAFDFDNHKLYAKARFVLTPVDGKAQYSPWSDVFCVNDYKAGYSEKFTAEKTSDKPAVSNVVLGDENAVYFDISFSDDTMKAAWQIKKIENFDMSLQSQVRYGAEKWQDWLIEDDLYPYDIGTRLFYLDGEKLDPETTVDFRCRLYYAGNAENGIPETATEWSDLIRIQNGTATVMKDDMRYDEFGYPKPPVSPVKVIIIVAVSVVVAALIILLIVKGMKKSKEQNDQIRKAAMERMEMGKAENDSFIRIAKGNAENKDNKDETATAPEKDEAEREETEADKEETAKDDDIKESGEEK
ncbi:MAG: hypothetical protein K6F09_05810 [Clostridiales bacterium]|nr:hypothetical protein [Clostridiales bacterium]